MRIGAKQKRWKLVLKIQWKPEKGVAKGGKRLSPAKRVRRIGWNGSRL